MELQPISEAERLLAHTGWMRELAGSLLGDPAAAEDVVQDTWIAALRHAPATDRPLEPWLARVVHNFAWKRRRGESRRADHELHARAPEAEPTPDETLERLELQHQVVDAVKLLEEPFRTTLVLRYFEGKNSAEIARIQGVPEGTVRWRLQRAIADLRSRLDGRFGSRAVWSALLLPFAMRHEAALAGASTSLGVATAAQGALAMSVALKVGVAVSVVALAGVVWWSRSSGEVADPRTTLAATPASEPAIAAPAIESGASAADREALAPASKAGVDAAPAMESAAATPAPPAIEPATVDMRFVDVNGAPWSHARVDCSDDDKIAAVSGADGRVELRVGMFSKDKGRHLVLRAQRAGCATVMLESTPRSGEFAHLGDIVLVPGVTLHGRVVDEQGRGIEKADVGVAVAQLDRDEEQRLHRHGSSTFGEHAFARSGDGGAFSIEGVAPGSWRLWGHTDGMRYNWSEPFEVQGAADRFDLQLILPALLPEDRIEGRVVDPRGNPVANAGITLGYAGKHESGTTTISCGADGRFRVVIYIDGVYRLFATDPEHRFATGAVFGLTPGMLDVELRLPEKRFVEVRAKDRDGARVAGVTLVISEEKENYAELVNTEAGPEGDPRFVVPGYPFLMLVRAEGYREARIGPLQPSAVGSAIDVVLDVVTRVRGRVQAEGRPVAGAKVTVVRALGAGSIVKNGFAMRMRTDNEAEGKSAAGGEFAIDVDVEPNVEVYVRVRADGWASSELGPFRVDAALAREFQFELTQGGSIEGRVLLPDGRDGEGTILGLNFGDGDAVTRRAGPGGHYRFDRLTPGKWQVVRRTEEMRPDTTMIRTEDDEAPIAWSCEVHDGRATHFDLDLTRP